MPYLAPDARQVQELVALPADRPIRMLNLLRFRDVAQGHVMSGQELYDRYAKRVRPLLTKLGGRVVYSGEPLLTIVGPEEEAWDRILIVEYPSRDHFIQLTRDPAFLRASEERTAALADWRLIALRVDQDRP